MDLVQILAARSVMRYGRGWPMALKTSALRVKTERIRSRWLGSIFRLWQIHPIETRYGLAPPTRGNILLGGQPGNRPARLWYGISGIQPCCPWRTTLEKNILLA